MDQSLRPSLERLRAAGELRTVTRAVDLRHELASVMQVLRGGPGLVFERIVGHTVPVVGNLFNSRRKLALCLGVEKERLQRHCIDAIDRGIAPEVVSEGPVQEVLVTGDPEIAKVLPVPHWFEKERGPYITAGVIIARDPETGKRNVSIARLRLEGGNSLLAGISPSHHLSRLMEKATARGENLPIAVAIGNHPALLLASQMYVALGHDEMEIAGALLGEPLRLLPCRTIPLEAPAEAEFIVEGELSPSLEKDEGPVSEFHGFYEEYGPGQKIAVKAITGRRDALYQAILPGFAPEHLLLGGEAIGATTCRALLPVIPSVRSVLVTEGGMGRLHAVITLERPRPGEAKRALLLAMGHTNLLKRAIAVDSDVDAEDPIQVEWALASRMKGDRDIFILPGLRCDRCDPLEERGLITKVAVDATAKSGDGGRVDPFLRALPPRAILERVAREIDDY